VGGFTDSEEREDILYIEDQTGPDGKKKRSPGAKETERNRAAKKKLGTDEVYFTIRGT